MSNSHTIKSDLTDYMCGPMNREGIVCSKYIDGFGLSLTSVGYKCSNCTDAWYGVPLYLLIEFVPITVFYLVILIFQINVASAPMSCFMMYSQFVLYDMLTKVPQRERILIQTNATKLYSTAIFLYGIWNLDLLTHIIPPFCVSSKLTTTHIIFLGYGDHFINALFECEGAGTQKVTSSMSLLLSFFSPTASLCINLWSCLVVDT